jgi:hypothetical protein
VFGALKYAAAVAAHESVQHSPQAGCYLELSLQVWINTFLSEFMLGGQRRPFGMNARSQNSM